MPHAASMAMSKTLNRILHTLAVAAFVIGLAPAAADAAPRKGTVAAKKTSKRVTRTFSASRPHRSVVRLATVPARPSFGQMAGLHSVQDQLDLKSSVALVIDQDTQRGAVLQERLGRAADRLAHQADDRADRRAGQAADGRDDHHHARTTWTPKRAAARGCGSAACSPAANCCTSR